MHTWVLGCVYTDRSNAECHVIVYMKAIKAIHVPVQKLSQTTILAEVPQRVAEVHNALPQYVMTIKACHMCLQTDAMRNGMSSLNLI